MQKKILYIDMDGVIADFDKGLEFFDPEINIAYTDNELLRNRRVDEICETNDHIFHILPPVENAVVSVSALFKRYEVYFLSTPMWNVPHSFTGKRIWIEKHFGDMASKRLILTHRKDLNKGEYLIDDRLLNGVEDFSGTHIHFRSPQFPDWEAVLNYLL